jgi:hypothetical protein
VDTHLAEVVPESGLEERPFGFWQSMATAAQGVDASSKAGNRLENANRSCLGLDRLAFLHRLFQILAPFALPYGTHQLTNKRLGLNNLRPFFLANLAWLRVRPGHTHDLVSDAICLLFVCVARTIDLQLRQNLELRGREQSDSAKVIRNAG